VRAVLFTLLNLILIVIAIWGLQDVRDGGPPPGKEASNSIKEIITRVDPQRLFSSIEVLSQETTRRFGSPGSEKTIHFITETLLDLGCDVEHQYVDVIDGNHNTATVTNILADLPGSNRPKNLLILCAHYDSKTDDPDGTAPGADDNATGVAVLLEIARVLAEAGMVIPIEFVFFGGEEDSLLGSKAFTKHLKKSGSRLMGAINVDMVGHDEAGPKDFIVFTDEFSTDLAEALHQCASTYTSLRCETEHLMTANSDNGSFWESGYKAVSVWEGFDHNPYHHTIEDTPDKLSRDFLTEITKVVLCAAIRLGSVGEMPFQLNTGSHLTNRLAVSGVFRVRHIGSETIDILPGTPSPDMVVEKQTDLHKMAP